MSVNEALSNYLRIVAGESHPRFKTVDLESRISSAFKVLTECSLCARECGVDRTAGERGYCEVGDSMSVSSAFDHLGEEYFFVPSFTIFFRSCTFLCQFCQNWQISQDRTSHESQEIDEARLAAAIDAHGYCRNVNFVGGDPTPYLPFILKTLGQVKADIPVVWNSNFYMSGASMELLKGIVDVYLSDFKYGNDTCAVRLSDAEDYSEVIRKNHRRAAEDAELVIRHLILPNHLDCCTKPVLDFIAAHLGDGVVVNLMDQYRPCFQADRYPDISRRLTADEFRTAVSHAERLGLTYIT